MTTDPMRQVEIERKYDVEEGALAPTFASVEGVESITVADPVQLEAVYYDTENLDLLRARIIIRRREGGGDEGWHIKRPAAEGRTELHWPLDVGGAASRNPATIDSSEPESGSVPDAEPESVPDAVLDAVRVVVRDRILTPLARISTQRTATHLLNECGAAVAEFADDSVTASDVRGGVVRTWREWEVELLPGAPDTEAGRTALLDAIETAVLAEAARVSSSPAKIARALGHESPLGAPEGAGSSSGDAGVRASSQVSLTAKSPASDVIVRVLRDLAVSLEQLDPLVRADEPDAVHQMRSVVRRMRSVLAAYGLLFDEERVASLRQQLKDLGGVLGAARDAEVRAQRAERELGEVGHRTDDAARARLVEASLEEYRQAHAAAVRGLSNDSYYRLLDALDEFAAHPPLSATGEKGKPIKAVAAKVIAYELARVRKRAGAAAFAVASGGGEPVDGPRENRLHETRKAARRLRFAAEAVSMGDTAVLGKRYRRVAEGAERVQDALGEHRDSALFVEHLLLTSNRAHAAGENTFVYGVLSEHVARRGAAALDAAPGALKRLDKRAEGF